MKQILLKIRNCGECTFVRGSALWKMHCLHPSMIHKDWDVTRISFPDKNGNNELKIPEWCPLEEV